MNVSRLFTHLILRLTPRRMRTVVQYHLRQACGKLETETSYLSRLAQPGTAAVDVGANNGMYTYPMQRSFHQVYAFEPHPHLADILRYLAPRTEVFNVAISDREGQAELHVPLQDSQTVDGRRVTVPLYGWSTLSPSPDSSERGESRPSHQTHTVDVAPLDAFHLEDVALVKIDVEGHEREVLEGARTTLERNRPTVIVEVKEAHRDEVYRFFRQIEYDRYTLADLVGVEGSPANEIYLPSDGSSVPRPS